MGHGKLKKFSENETFTCLLQPDSSEILAGKEQGAAFSHSPLVLKDHPVKGRWNEEMFGGRDCPIVLELGCGKGEYTVDLALRNPGMNYVGVDIKGARMWKGAKQATEGNIVNAAFLRTRIEFVEAFFAPGEVSEIWLTFSDPQMKSENSRLVSPMFLERYRKFLKPGGVVHLKTDSTFLFEYTRAVCSANGLKVLACTSDLYSGDREEMRGSALASVCGPDAVDALFEVQTFYEKNFLKQGFKINYISFTIDREGDYIYPEFDAAYWRAAEAPRFLPGHQF
ncbi:MAG: tRNA (guanosine(46)-N7)-methyltransferase TrmB [Candidatus Cryptobacteroides sp.]